MLSWTIVSPLFMLTCCCWPHVILCTGASLAEWGSVTETSKGMLLHNFQRDHLQSFPSLPFIRFPILPIYHIYPTIRQAHFMIRKIPTQSMFNFVHIHKATIPNLFYERALHWAPVSTGFKATTYMYIADMQLIYKYYRESHLYSNFYVLCFKFKLPYSETSTGSSWLQMCLCTAWSQYGAVVER